MRAREFSSTAIRKSCGLWKRCRKQSVWQRASVTVLREVKARAPHAHEEKISITLALMLLCISTAAQTSAPLQTGKFPLVLAVVYNPELPPAYQLLPDGSGHMYSRFARIKNWQQAPGSLSVDAVYVTSTMEGEAVTVRVAVLYGKFHDAGTLLSTYQAHENEKIVVSALTRFGIEPFEITPIVPSAPKLENKTKALDIVSVQPEGLSLP